MFNNPDPFFTQVKRAASRGFGLQGSRFRFVVYAQAIGEVPARKAAACEYDQNSIATADGGRRLLTTTELQEHILTAAIELSNAIRGDLYWNFGVEVQQACPSCGKYES